VELVRRARRIARRDDLGSVAGGPDGHDDDPDLCPDRRQSAHEPMLELFPKRVADSVAPARGRLGDDPSDRGVGDDDDQADTALTDL
jgi:hypothetical protein